MPRTAIHGPDGSQYWDGAKWVPVAAEPQQSRSAGDDSADLPPRPLEQKLLSIGTVAIGAVFMGVSVFLDWYEFTSADNGNSVPALSGFASGPGVGAIVIAVFVLLNAAVWWVAERKKTMRFIATWLLVDAGAAVVIVVVGFVNIGSGHWVIVATNAPLRASPGAGLILFSVCTAALTVRAVQLRFAVGTRTRTHLEAENVQPGRREGVGWDLGDDPLRFWFWPDDGRGWVRKPYVDRYGHFWDGVTWHRDTRPIGERWMAPEPPEPRHAKREEQASTRR